MVDKHRKYDIIITLYMRYLIIIIACCGIMAAPAAFSIDIKPIKYQLETAEENDKTSPGPVSNKEEPGESIEKPKVWTKKDEPDEVLILKKADVSRISARAAYEEFAGLRFAKYFTVAQRVEIYQEARPIDSYILDAKAIRYLGIDTGENIKKWDTPAHFRSQITPLFTRAYGTQFTIDNPDDPSGQIAQLRYTLDYRELYREYHPKWAHLLWSHWAQHEVMLIHGTQIPGINWTYTINLGYRYSTIIEKNTDTTPTNAGYQNRHTYIVNLAFAPSPQLEWFGQFEYFKSKRPRSTFPYSPDHFYWRTELRLKSPDLKTSFIPSFSYSKDYYWPFRDTFQKYEISARIGHDFSEKLSITSQLDYVLSLRDEPDNNAPDYGTTPRPIKDSAAYMGLDNRISYNIWNNFYLQSGVDFAAGLNMSDFDNWGTLLGIEYYKPGILRANFGWNTNHYYNIDDFMNSVEFRVYIFM